MSETGDPTDTPAPAPAQPDASPSPASPDARNRKTKDKPAKAPPRSALSKLFVIKPLGYVRLVLLCVLVGFVILTLRFDPAAPGFSAGDAVADLARNTWAAMSWGVQNLWKPALAGATVVLPLWVLWRLISFPFRR